MSSVATNGGNIRELQNILERSVILSRGRTLELAMPEIDPLLVCAEPASSGSGSCRVRESAGVAGAHGAARRSLKRTMLQARMKKLGIQGLLLSPAVAKILPVRPCAPCCPGCPYG